MDEFEISLVDGIINNHEVAFDNFMAARRNQVDPKSKTKSEYTHTRMAPPYGSYNIKDDEYDEFINLYKRVIKTRIESITEKQKEIGPLLIDLDFRQAKEYRDRQYRESHIEQIIKYCIDIFNDTFQYNRNDWEALVFEKDQPTFDAKQNNYKDGFHIVIPVGLHVKHRFYVFEKLKQMAVNNKLFDDIKFINTIDDVFDISTISRNGWLMYRSKKAEGQLYKLTNVYNNKLNSKFKYNSQGVQTNVVYDDDELVIHLSVRRYSEDDLIKLKKGVVIEEEKIANLQSKKPKTKEEIINQTTDYAKKHKIELSDKDNSFLTKIIDILSDERASRYMDWISVGWALFNIDKGLINLFKKFSQKCADKYDEYGCERVWNSAREGGYGLSSLVYWARSDNPKKYSELLRDNNTKLLEEAENGTDDDISKLIYEWYKYFYVCSSIRKGIWYEFQNHRWVLIENGYTLQNKISDELTTEFARLTSIYYIAAADEQDAMKKDNMLARAKKIGNIITKLKTQSSKNTLITSCANRFFRKNFEGELDENKDLFGCDNGVYDLRNNIFRKGVPEDKLTLTCKYDYVDYKTTSPEVLEVMEFLKQIYPDPSIFEYVMLLLSSFLDGHNTEQKFPIFTGVGCHEAGTGIIMNDNTVKLVENIKINDLIMGDDNTARKVKKLFHGTDMLYTVYCTNGVQFTVNKSHRLALKCCHKNNKTKDGDKNILTWYEYKDDIPIRFSTSATTKNKDIYDKNQSYLNYNDIIPVMVEDYILLDEQTRKDFCMVNSKGENIHIDKIEFKCNGKYYGFELDGNKRYQMDNFIITYNSNGKSTMTDLLSHTFGEYYGVFSPAVITQKTRNSSGPTPELANKRGVRLITIQEAEDDEPIRVGKMKGLTAGDLIEANPKHRDPFSYKPQFKLILICNTLPPITANDGGTWRRIIVVPHESKFVNGVPSKPNEFKKDPTVNIKLIQWKSTFLWILINVYYPKYKKNGIIEPDKVKLHTESYNKDCDIVLEFLKEGVTITGQKRDKESVNDLYTGFNQWYKSTGNTGKCPTNREFKKYFAELSDPSLKSKLVIKNNYISGIKIKGFNFKDNDDSTSDDDNANDTEGNIAGNSTSNSTK